MPTSQNGWSANDPSVTTTWRIPGTSRDIRLRQGDAGFLLVHFAAWFHEHIEAIDTGIYDDWGYAERPIRGSTTTLSNHASGTAIDLNATRHPLGVSGSFTPAQAADIRTQLRKYGGALRWGGDYSGRKDEMHVEINAGPAAVATVAKMLREEDDMTPQEVREIARDEIAKQIKAAFADADETIKVDVGKNADWSLERAVRWLVKRQARK